MNKQYNVTVLFRGNKTSLVNAALSSNKAVAKLQGQLGKNKNAKAATASAVKYRKELSALQVAAKRMRTSGGVVPPAQRQKIEMVAQKLRDARRAAKGYGVSLRHVGKDAKVASRALAGLNYQLTKNKLAGGGRLGGIGGRLGGGIASGIAPLLGVAAAVSGIRSVVVSKMKEEQALFRLGTVSGQGAGTAGRRNFKEEQRAWARQQTQETGIGSDELLTGQYQLLSAGLPPEVAKQAAIVASKVAVVTGGTADETAATIGIMYNNFADKISGTAKEKITHIADLLTQTQLQYQIKNFRQLGAGLRYATATAKTFNIPLTDTVALVGQLNTLGLDAEKAGTGFNAFIRQLTKTKTQDAFEYDLVKTKNGQLDVVKTTAELTRALAAMKDELGEDAAMQKMQEFFGDEGLRAASLFSSAMAKVAENVKQTKREMAGVNESNFSDWANDTTADTQRVASAWSNVTTALFTETGFLKQLATDLTGTADAIRYMRKEGVGNVLGNVAKDFFLMRPNEQKKKNEEIARMKKRLEDSGISTTGKSPPSSKNIVVTNHFNINRGPSESNESFAARVTKLVTGSYDAPNPEQGAY